MNHRDAVQMMTEGVGIVDGADVDYHVPTEQPCIECGGMVDLSAMVTVKVVEADGSLSESQMTEANARQLMAEVGFPPLPVMCDRHDPVEVEVSIG